MWDWELFWTWLGRVADASSLVAAAASGYAAFKIGRIGARLAFNVKADQVLMRVGENAEWIENSLSSGDVDTNLLLSKIAQCKAEIESIKKGVSGDASNEARQLKVLYADFMKALDAGANEDERRQMLWGMYNAIKAFHIHATSILSNRKMGVPDASV